MYFYLAATLIFPTGAGDLRFNYKAGQIGHCHQRLTTVALFLYFPGDKPRCTPPLVTSFGLIPRVRHNEDLIFFKLFLGVKLTYIQIASTYDHSAQTQLHLTPVVESSTQLPSMSTDIEKCSRVRVP